MPPAQFRTDKTYADRSSAQIARVIAMAPRFVHLHLHTEYSLADSLIRIPALMNAVATAGMPAVALTDYTNMFAVVKFYRAAMAHGIKPLIGVEAQLQGMVAEGLPDRVVLLCKDETGYRNLTRLVTRAYLEGQHGRGPMLQRQWLTASSAGLIVLSAAREGDIGKALLAGNQELAAQCLDYWQHLFPDNFYLEVQRTGREGDEEHLHAAVALAQASGIPVVASNDVRFLRAEEFEAHEVRVCIHEGQTLTDSRYPRRYSDQQYLRSPEEMASLFDDLPEALENSVEIAQRCNLSLTFEKNVLPEFPIPEGKTPHQYFRELAYEGLAERLQAPRDVSEPEVKTRQKRYQGRLETELDVITSMGFAGYFLIVADFIRWARENGVPVGPGRGSGAGSLVAYALKITDLDPLQYDLLFERFLNPERVSMPDFDVDFCMEGRDRVIDYVARRYGRERVSQIITYGRMAAKAVVRDVGRVLGHAYGFVDKIAKMIPFEIGITLQKALEQEPDLRQAYEQEEEVQAIIDMARALEGLSRNAGKHAGGVVIAPTRLTDFTPLYCEPGSLSVVTQLDKDDVEAIGLVKFDFLGLRTLTIIDRAVHHINRKRQTEDQTPIDIACIPRNDKLTFELLQRQQTTAVFQLESRGIKELIKRLKPDNFEDIVALVALYRPGPLQSGMVDDFILRKHGVARVEYAHPEVEPILKSTYGVILYQEQVMQIAQTLAGYTLGGADLLRRAMGKKKPAEMAKQRKIFLQGATERGVSDITANHIFDLMEKFAGYGFNKSHSVAYALLSYQTAWLKAHYPAAFMASVLSADMDNTDKIVNLIDECRSMGLEVMPPDINRSLYAFTVLDDCTILYGLGAIKGVGQAALEGLISSREHIGPFTSLDDLCRRADTQKLNRRVIEALIRSGALDSIGPNRATLMAHIADAMRLAEQHLHNTHTGQNDLFGEVSLPANTQVVNTLPEWDEQLRLTAEKETLGLYLTGHPVSRYERELACITSRRIAELVGDEHNGHRDQGEPQTVVVAGLVTAIRLRSGQNGRMAFITLDDQSGRIEVGLFADNYQNYANLLHKDKILVVEGNVGLDEYTGNVRLRAKRLLDIEQARAHYAKRIDVRISGSNRPGKLIDALQDVLTPFRNGHCPVRINYINAVASVNLTLDENWRVLPADQLIERLRELEAVEQADVVYS
jgi:DNA polymerase-3 subunit alpha